MRNTIGRDEKYRWSPKSIQITSLMRRQWDLYTVPSIGKRPTCPLLELNWRLCHWVVLNFHSTPISSSELQLCGWHLSFVPSGRRQSKSTAADHKKSNRAVFFKVESLLFPSCLGTEQLQVFNCKQILVFMQYKAWFNYLLPPQHRQYWHWWLILKCFAACFFSLQKWEKCREV